MMVTQNENSLNDEEDFQSLYCIYTEFADCVYTCLLTETLDLKLNDLGLLLQKWIRKRNCLFHHTVVEIKQKVSDA
jgi:hypothetical protein